MPTATSFPPKVASREEWLDARKALFAREMAAMIHGRIGKARPELRPWLRGTFLACSAVALVGFGAQLVDGSLGMAYGVTSTTLLLVIGTNPAASMPNLPEVRRGLERAELVIVQDAYHPTETTRFAHVVLPAAVNFEQAGVFCNSERRVTLMEQVVPPPGAM